MKKGIFFVYSFEKVSELFNKKFREMYFIGEETCWVHYDHTDSGATEKLPFDIYVENQIVLFKNRLNESRSIVIIDEKHINHELYKKYKLQYRVAEVAKIQIQDSILSIEGFIPYVYWLRYWLGYGVKIEIRNSEIIKSIMSLQLPSSLLFQITKT